MIAGLNFHRAVAALPDRIVEADGELRLVSPRVISKVDGRGAVAARRVRAAAAWAAPAASLFEWRYTPNGRRFQSDITRRPLERSFLRFGRNSGIKSPNAHGEGPGVVSQSEFPRSAILMASL